MQRVAFVCREVWKAYAARQGGRGPYLRFANMLINDSIYLLDESLKYVKVKTLTLLVSREVVGIMPACTPVRAIGFHAFAKIVGVGGQVGDGTLACMLNTRVASSMYIVSLS
jgi:hypothetical protein